MAQGLIPAGQGIGRIDRLIVADAHPQPGMLAEHVPAGLPMGQPLNDGKVGWGDLHPADVHPSQERQKVEEALGDGLRQKLQPSHHDDKAQQDEGQGEQGCRPAAAHHVHHDKGSDKAQPGPPRPGHQHGSQHENETSRGQSGEDR